VPRAVRVQNATITDRDVQALHFRNNIFQTTGGVPLVQITSGQLAGATDLKFQANDYFASGGAFHVLWGGASYSSLSTWRASGQELIGSASVGRSVDPRLEAAGAGATLGDASRLETLAAYRLQPGSPLINAGLNLAAMFSLDSGGLDFYGTRIVDPPDIGACEHSADANGSLDVVMYARNANAIAGSWVPVADSTAASGVRLRNPDAGAARIAQALVSPSDYFELTFVADAGRDYRLWIRGKAYANSGLNDSVHVQFSDSVDAAGAAVWRLGTSSATVVNLEDCSGCGLAGSGWQDNGYGAGALGRLVRFANSGAHRLRIQTREDGFSIDQVVLSASAYFNASPGSLINDSTILPISSTSSTIAR
jgi:hypothetical protein